jgi:erythromycin esterase-like protein
MGTGPDGDQPSRDSDEEVVEIIRREARPCDAFGDLAPLLDAIGDARLVLLGEATHGTHEFYQTRAELTRALIETHGSTWWRWRPTGRMPTG